MVLSNNRNETVTTTTIKGAQSAPLAQNLPQTGAVLPNQQGLVKPGLQQQLPGTTQTTVTTTSTSIPQQPLLQQASNIIKKDAVVTNVMEKPILQNIIEKKDVEVHHKNVVQEVHEQKIIEIERQNVLQNVNKGTVFEQSKAETRFEEIGTGAIGEQERLRLEQLRLAGAPKIIQQQGPVQQIREGEVVAEVVKQEFVERHVQPVITEVREQNIVQEVIHPVVRKIHEAPIIREVTSTVAPTMMQGTQTQFLATNFHPTLLRPIGYNDQQWRDHQLRYGLRPHGMLDNEWREYQSQKGGLFGAGLIRPTGMNDLQWREHQLGQGFRPTGMADNEWHQWHSTNSSKFFPAQFQGSQFQQTQFQQGGFQQPLTRPTGYSDLQWRDYQLQRGVRPTGMMDSEWNEWRERNYKSGSTLGTGLGGASMTTTTQTNHGLNATTTTSGLPPLQAEIKNFTEHEHKVNALERGNLTNSEVSNLTQHERVVDQVLHNQAPLTTGTTALGAKAPGSQAPLTTGTTTTKPFNQPLDDTTHKQGFMARMKEKMHRSHNK